MYLYSTLTFVRHPRTYKRTTGPIRYSLARSKHGASTEQAPHASTTLPHTRTSQSVTVYAQVRHGYMHRPALTCHTGRSVLLGRGTAEAHWSPGRQGRCLLRATLLVQPHHFSWGACHLPHPTQYSLPAMHDAPLPQPYQLPGHRPPFSSFRPPPRPPVPGCW